MKKKKRVAHDKILINSLPKFLIRGLNPSDAIRFCRRSSYRERKHQHRCARCRSTNVSIRVTTNDIKCREKGCGAVTPLPPRWQRYASCSNPEGFESFKEMVS